MSVVSEYSSVLLFFMLAAVVSSMFAMLPIFLARREETIGKLSTYECGFDRKESCESVFDVRFCVVAILFVIFDIEVAFLFPWAVSLGEIGAYGFWSMVAFMGLFAVGFVYEWGSGALDWE